MQKQMQLKEAKTSQKLSDLENKRKQNKLKQECSKV